MGYDLAECGPFGRPRAEVCGWCGRTDLAERNDYTEGTWVQRTGWVGFPMAVTYDRGEILCGYVAEPGGASVAGCMVTWRTEQRLREGM